jgi:hypothetical protein
MPLTYHENSGYNNDSITMLYAMIRLFADS